MTGADSYKTAAGIFVQDDSAEPRIQADISHNTINAQAPGNEGISVQFAKGAAISGNTISGTAGSDAIGLKSVTHSTVSGNDVSGFKPDASLGQSDHSFDQARPMTASRAWARKPHRPRQRHRQHNGRLPFIEQWSACHAPGESIHPTLARLASRSRSLRRDGFVFTGSLRSQPHG